MDLAFAKGLKMKQFPLMGRAIQTPLPHEVPFQAAFSVAKRRFRRAVDRNRIKRLLKEAWRLEKSRLAKNWEPGSPQWAVVFIFVGTEIPTFSECQGLMALAVERLEMARRDAGGRQTNP